MQVGDRVLVSVPDPKSLGKRILRPAKLAAEPNSKNDPQSYFRRKYGDGFWVDFWQPGDPVTEALFGAETNVRGAYIRYYAFGDLQPVP